MTLVVFVSGLLLLAGLASARDETGLRKKLMSDYNKNALPAVLTNVSVRFTVLNIDMDEERQAMVMETWIAMEWEDSRLGWNTTQYPDIKKLTFPHADVWTPDLTLYNNVRLDKFDVLTETLVLSFPTGSMMYVPPALLEASCVLDMTYWPHDVHNCTAKFGSWVHSGHTLNLLPKDDGAEVEFEMISGTQNGHTLTRGSWEVLNNSVKRNSKFYDCCPEPYIDLTVNIVVKRNAPAYDWTVKVPVLAMSVLTGILFLLPPGSVEKIMMGTFILLLEMLFLGNMKDIVKYSPSHTPLIVQLVGEQLVLTLVCVFISVLIVRLVRDPHSGSLPGWLKGILFSLASFFCLSGYKKMVTSPVDGSYPRLSKGEELEMTENRGMVSNSTVRDRVSTEQAEWLLLGAILDRLFLILYIISLISKIIAFSAVL